MREVLLIVLAWLGTYLLHSTVLLGGVWMLTSHITTMLNAWKELLWRMALLVPIVTATLQFISNPPTSYSAFTFAQQHARAEQPNPVAHHLHQSNDDELAWLHTETDAESSNRGLHSGVAESPQVSDAAPIADADVPIAASKSTIRDHARAGRSMFLMVVGSVVCGGFMLMLLRLWQVERLLKNRRPVEDAAIMGMFDAMRQQSSVTRRVRLTCSASIRTPVAVGVLRPEICLPKRALTELDGPQLRALLAHELAHHAGRDPLWLWIYQHVALWLPIQPLNRLALHRLRDLAELRCDDWAAQQVGCRLSVARCLADVAAWLVPPPPTALVQTVPGMAQRPSMLRTRISRLLDDHSAQVRRVGRPTALIVLMLLIVAGTPLLPGVRREGQASTTPIAAPEAQHQEHLPAREEESSSARTLRTQLEQLHLQISMLTEQMQAMEADLGTLPEDEQAIFRAVQERLHMLRARCESLQDAGRIMRELQVFNQTPNHSSPTEPGPLRVDDGATPSRNTDINPQGETP